ncbi:hypothetical protein SH661x_001246 [Planctomicrobium sp. SH661]|uniref:hypothetical protein n=1 Tax=Planctomicrobium sp. SH661 TaxID=3448124 RepID=UPI003F5C110F
MHANASIPTSAKLRATFGGAIAGTCSFPCALAIVMNVVPRRNEGSRLAVDIPWTIYALLTVAASLTLLPFIGLFLRKSSAFFSDFAGYAGIVLICMSVSLPSLRRDFMGNF